MNNRGIQIQSLSKYYGTMHAVKGIDLHIQEGEFLTLLGPSGSGKTTTLRMVAGLESVDSGSITVNGQVFNDGKRQTPTHERNIGMVFQSYALWPHKSVFENIAFPLKMRNVSQQEISKRVHDMLDLVELDHKDYATRYPSQLSGGQQQRVALARALVGKPQVLLYDEPLSNLDARLRESMRTLMRQVHNKIGVTSLYVTHDQLEAMVLSDRVCVMDRGEIIQAGSPSEVFNRPKSVFVAEFLGAANILPITDLDPVRELVTLAPDVRLRVAQCPTLSSTDSSKQHKLVVRHHHIKLLDPHHVQSVGSPTDPNRLEAKVMSKIFLGERIRYEFQIGEHLIWVAELPALDEGPELHAHVCIELDPAHCLVL
jgi:ABC-type Fe3+/spermidine/putrescine transport system ATPase subunit